MKRVLVIDATTPGVIFVRSIQFALDDRASDAEFQAEISALPTHGARVEVVMVYVLSLIALCLCASPRCVAQELVPIIQLTPGETAEANQLAGDLKTAQERNKKAIADWRLFQETYQAAHPELPNLRFTADFRFAVDNAYL
jgi:hypothetical protein